uniref:NADH-plastoquinone oxidoreductase subunit 7 n=1 Tax=Sinogentiana souliei TaxID=267666 RepID=A0A8F4XMX0_9GENT|nr:NADH-plastoquinone oxidoreductase subunit 7 [Sinogentiana souliei]
MTGPDTRKDLMIVNMGPLVTLDGENVVDCEPIYNIYLM